MRAVIGNSLLAKLTPQTTAYDIWDEKLTGFILRVNPSGSMVYRCEYARGKRVTLDKSTVLTPAQARDKAKEILSQAALGISPEEKKPRDQITFQEFINDEYEAWRIAHRKNGKADMHRLKVNFMNELGSRLLTDIIPIVIDKWRTNRINDGIRIATVNRDIVTLKSTLSKAVEWGVMKEHPLRRLKLQKIDSTAKIRYLSNEEEVRLRAAIEARDHEIKHARTRANEWRKARRLELYDDLTKYAFGDHMTPMILFSLNTGLRRGELFNLRWENVDFHRAMITISGDVAKSGNTTHIPLNATSLKVLSDWRKQVSGDELVFVNPETGRV